MTEQMQSMQTCTQESVYCDKDSQVYIHWWVADCRKQYCRYCCCILSWSLSLALADHVYSTILLSKIGYDSNLQSEGNYEDGRVIPSLSQLWHGLLCAPLCFPTSPLPNKSMFSTTFSKTARWREHDC